MSGATSTQGMRGLRGAVGNRCPPSAPSPQGRSEGGQGRRGPGPAAARPLLRGEGAAGAELQMNITGARRGQRRRLGPVGGVSGGTSSSPSPSSATAAGRLCASGVPPSSLAAFPAAAAPRGEARRGARGGSRVAAAGGRLLPVAVGELRFSPLPESFEPSELSQLRVRPCSWTGGERRGRGLGAAGRSPRLRALVPAEGFASSQ